VKRAYAQLLDPNVHDFGQGARGVWGGGGGCTSFPWHLCVLISRSFIF
jgi:hypothetical protein